MVSGALGEVSCVNYEVFALGSRAQSLKSDTRELKIIPDPSTNCTLKEGVPLCLTRIFYFDYSDLHWFEMLCHCSRSGTNHVHVLEILYCSTVLSSYSCFQVDLSLTAWAHTIPRLFIFSVAPGDNLELYANAAVKGLPSPDDHSWSGELVGQERVITVRPTDAAYVAGKYLVSIITAAVAVEFGMKIEVAPFSTALRHGDNFLPGSGPPPTSNIQGSASLPTKLGFLPGSGPPPTSNIQGSASPVNKIGGTKSSSDVGFGIRVSRGLQPLTGIARVVDHGDRSGRTLSRLVAYTEGRKRQYRFGSSASPKTRSSTGGESSTPSPVRPHSAMPYFGASSPATPALSSSR